MTKTEKQFKGIDAFIILYFVGLIIVVKQLINYSQWTIQLLKKWQLPSDPFFSKIHVVSLESSLTLYQYVGFAIAYIVFYSFILIGLIQLYRTITLLSKKKFILSEMSADFKKAANSFLVFIVGTFVVDLVLLFTASTSIPTWDLLTPETLFLILLAYSLYFTSDILYQKEQLYGSMG